MAISDNKITNAEIAEVHVQAAPDTLTGSAQQNKAVFDAYSDLIKEKHNSLIDDIDGEYASNWRNGSQTGSVRTTGSEEEGDNYTIGQYAAAEGRQTKASGSNSHAEGFRTQASKYSSHAEGHLTNADGNEAHAEGRETLASGNNSHAEGQFTNATGDNSHAEGNSAEASGNNSHAEGYGTIASSSDQHVSGRYNIEDTNNIYAEIIGNGTSLGRGNGRTLDWNGNEVLAGKLTVGTEPENNKDVATKGYVDTGLAGKVDKVTGKGLSTEDYTTSEKAKLSNIEAGAEVNVQADWNQSDSNADDYIKNKPPVPSVDSTLSTSGAAADALVTGNEITALTNDLTKWARLEGVVTTGNLIPPYAVDHGSGVYYWNGSEILYLNYAPYSTNYMYYKIPVTGGETYCTSKEARWWVTIDGNGDKVDYGEYANTFATGSNAEYAYFSYNINNYDDFDLFYGTVVPADKNTQYHLPDNVIKNIPNDTIEGEMIDGFEYGNIKKFIPKIREDNYCYSTASETLPVYQASNLFDVYYLKAEAIKYSFSDEVRFVVPVDENGYAISASVQSVFSYDNTNGNAEALLLSINKARYPNIIISKGNVATTENVYPDWLEQLKTKTSLSECFDTFRGDYTEEIKLNSVICSASSNVEYAFNANIANWASNSVLTFSLYGGNVTPVKFEITDTEIVLTDYNYNNPITTTVSHGLAISNNIQLHIKQVRNTVFELALVSDGVEYTHEFSTAKQYNTYPAIKATNVTLTDCSFSWGSRDVSKTTWCFGDSYFGANDPSRWVYYLIRDGYYESHLFSNYGGANSVGERESLEALLTIAKPKRIFWALGMNDGSDSDSTPVALWKNAIDWLIPLCEAHEIELVLATIPSVPAINHEAKNAFVRASGYQYVDFAKAVGAQSDGTWFSGMLSGDNVHPTAKGALALYNRVLSDFQQITIK